MDETYNSENHNKHKLQGVVLNWETSSNYKVGKMQRPIGKMVFWIFHYKFFATFEVYYRVHHKLVLDNSMVQDDLHKKNAHNRKKDFLDEKVEVLLFQVNVK